VLEFINYYDTPCLYNTLYFELYPENALEEYKRNFTREESFALNARSPLLIQVEWTSQWRLAGSIACPVIFHRVL